MGIFSTPKPPKSPSTLESVGVATLGGVQVSLTLLEKLMDGTSIPFVKGAVGTALEVIKIAKAIQADRDDCDILIKRTTSILIVILDSLRGKTEKEIPDHLKRAVERLSTSFQEVLDELRIVDKRVGKRSSASIARAILYHFDNTEKLQGCSAKLEWAMNEFQVTSKVGSCLKDLEHHEELRKEMRENQAVVREGQQMLQEGQTLMQEGQARLQIELHDGQEKIQDAQSKIQDGQAKIQEDLAQIREVVKEKISANLPLSLPSTVMPANPRIFGRQSYIDKAVLLLLSAGSTRLVILGAGGMGKTSVALKIVYDPRVIKRFGKNRIWLPCEQATSLALLTELLAKSLGLPPSTTTDRFGEVVAALEESDTYYFILLDNFETPWDIEGEQSGVANVLARLASIPTVSFIVTMRGIQHPASNLVDWTSPRLPPLTPLEMDPAQEAFLKISPESEGDPRLPELLRELDCVPLAITLMAKLAEVGETISELLSQWKLEQIKLLSQPGGDRGSSIEVSIRLSLMSLSVRNNADAVPLLSILARLPGGASLSLLSTICPSIPGWKTAMRVLRTAALVYDSPDKTVVHMLSPIRSYVLLHHPLLPAPLQHLRDAYFTLADKGRAYFGEDNFHDAVLELSKEETNLDTIILDSLHDEESKQDAIAAAIQYSNYLTHTQPRNNIATAAIQVARETGSANLATCLECYGDLLRFQSQVVAADLALKEARLLFIQQGDELRAAYCQWKIGDNLRLQNELEDAVSTLEEAKVNFTKLHHLVGVGDCLWVLGQIFGMQGELEKAQSTLEEAKSLFVELRGHMGIASCLRSLGRIHYELGQYEAAASATEEAKTTYIKLGSPFDIAECLRALSDIYCEQGRYSEAHLVAEAARSEFARLGSKLGLARTLQSTGYIFYKQGRYNEAFSFVENAKNELAKIGGFLDIATIEQLQGNVYRMQGKYDAACSSLEVAKSLFMKRRSRSNLIGIADCNLSLGKTFRLQAQYDKAIELLEDALATYSTQNHKKSQAAECAEEIELALKERDDCELAN